MNPRAGVTDLLVFEARPFSHLGTPPYELDYNLNQDECPVLFQERYDTIVSVRSQSGAGCEADAFMNMRAELLRIQVKNSTVHTCHPQKAHSVLFRCYAAIVAHSQALPVM